jgi:putative redox protein
MSQATRHLASVHVVGKTRFQQEVQARKHALRSDEYGTSGGDDTGPTPVELLLAAVGACTSTTLRMYADRKGWDLGEIKVDLRVVEEAGVRRIERRLRLGAELPEDARKRLVEIADKTPVTKMVRDGLPIDTRLD